MSDLEQTIKFNQARVNSLTSKKAFIDSQLATEQTALDALIASRPKPAATTAAPAPATAIPAPVVSPTTPVPVVAPVVPTPIVETPVPVPAVEAPVPAVEAVHAETEHVGN